MKISKKLLSGLLCMSVLFSACPSTGFAEEIKAFPEEGLCEHHPKHDESCGYSAAVPGTNCSHEHSEDCYREVEKCIHRHTSDCYPEYDDDDSEDTSTRSKARRSKKRRPTECDHECSIETGCIKYIPDCPHARGDQVILTQLQFQGERTLIQALSQQTGISPRQGTTLSRLLWCL